ncbi:MAG: radical SAM protein [Candidatus Aenigmarchaeota archaeon]|nr:radical SAM protein [Candidatus Aenigmarchaeota archaeon]
MTDWPVTFKCNNNCISCILNRRVTENLEDPPISQLESILEKIDENNDYLGLSGGEPTIRKDFFKILELIKEKKPELFVFLVSNGRMFKYKWFVKKLKEVKPKYFKVAVALYGPNKELHDFITRVKGSFEQALIGIKNLTEAGIDVEVRTVISRLNYKFLPEISTLIVREFPSVERVVYLNMKYTGNAFLNRRLLLVRIKDVVPFALKAVDILKENNINIRLYHFPLCLLPKDYWEIAKGMTKQELYEFAFAKVCMDCDLVEECPRIWKTYLYLVGEDEFKPIKLAKKKFD